MLPVFTPAAIPGLTLGCVIANLGSPLGVVDWVFGPLATLLAALATYLVRDVKVKGLPILAPLPPVITNVVIVGFELAVSPMRGPLAWGTSPGLLLEPLPYLWALGSWWCATCWVCP